jgi:hypothetical protein
LSDPSRPPSERSALTPTSALVGERRYTEEELALILNRAAERQEGVQASAPRYSLADIQEIAAGAGIAPDHVASVAMSLRDRSAPRERRFLGAPFSFRFDDTIAGELSDDVVAELLEIARRELGVQGQVVEALGTIEWKGQDMGWTHVTVTRRGGQTQIGILSGRDEAVAASGAAGGLGTLFGSMTLAITLGGPVGLARPVAALAGIALATTGSWLAVRLAWHRYSRRSAERVSALGSALIEAARRTQSVPHER